MKADETLDCVGLYCPMPIVHTAKRMKELKPGQVLEVLSDDPGIKQDMPSWCKTTGNEFLGIEEDKGVYRGFVRKSGK
ncbi:MAG: sulfurtransferase TusA family protein [Chloroflexi bacterium]|nr:sulfurtransferase TusA family protein [Chloroflexota bacterium]